MNRTTPTIPLVLPLTGSGQQVTPIPSAAPALSEAIRSGAGSRGTTADGFRS